MSFIETFLAVFIATIMGQISAWWFKKELEHRLDKGYERIKGIVKNNGGNKMGKLAIDIEHGSNGGYVVTWYKTLPSSLQKLAGTKAEKEVLAFTNVTELAKWIENHS